MQICTPYPHGMGYRSATTLARIIDRRAVASYCTARLQPSLEYTLGAALPTHHAFDPGRRGRKCGELYCQRMRRLALKPGQLGQTLLFVRLCAMVTVPHVIQEERVHSNKSREHSKSFLIEGLHVLPYRWQHSGACR